MERNDERKREKLTLTLSGKEKERLRKMAEKERKAMTDYIRWRLFGDDEKNK